MRASFRCWSFFIVISRLFSSPVSVKLIAEPPSCRGTIALGLHHRHRHHTFHRFHKPYHRRHYHRTHQRTIHHRPRCASVSVSVVRYLFPSPLKVDLAGSHFKSEVQKSFHSDGINLTIYWLTLENKGKSNGSVFLALLLWDVLPKIKRYEDLVDFCWTKIVSITKF